MSDYRHFLDLPELAPETIRSILDSARAIKTARKGWPKGKVDRSAPLSGHVLGMIFEKSSTRTRVSFDVGMRQLGGETLMLSSNETQLGRGETIADTARVLSRMVDVIMIRTDAHDKLMTLAEYASVPVINALTDWSHPCQLMADVLTYEEHRGPIEGRRFAWLGDGSNVAVSLIHIATKLRFSLRLACPAGYEPPQEALEWAADNQGDVKVTHDPVEAVSDADCVVTDAWVSMGTEESRARVEAMTPYSVDDSVMVRAKPDALFMHCLPAHRGEEVTDEVMDGPQSVIWDEAENRLHAQKAILRWCLKK